MPQDTSNVSNLQMDMDLQEAMDILESLALMHQGKAARYTGTGNALRAFNRVKKELGIYKNAYTELGFAYDELTNQYDELLGDYKEVREME